MGKRGQNKKKAKGTEKTLMKREKKAAAKYKKMIERVGERDIMEIVNQLEEEQIRLTSVNEYVCEPPSPRANFSFVPHPHDEEIILFGGEIYNGKIVTVYNEMYFYNVETKLWKKLEVPAGPVARSGHQMVAVPTNAGGELWLFGGEHASPSQLQFHHFRDLWVFHLASRRWEKVESENAPSARSGHRMVLQHRQLVLFGGFFDSFEKYEYYNDVHIFDLDTRQWRQIKPDGFIKPAPRSGCCMAAYPDGRILIWGGYTKTKLRKQVFAGRTFTDMYEIVPQPNPAVAGEVQYLWRQVNPGGPKMLALNSISFTRGPNEQIYCFGGVMDVDEDDEDLQGKFTQDLVALDLPSQVWRILKVGEKEVETSAAAALQPPMMKCGSAALASGYVAPAPSTDSILVPNLFRKQSRNAPTPRMHAGICVLKDTLYVFGGMFEESDRVYTYNDLYTLNLKDLSAWKVLIPNNENVHEWIPSDDEDDKQRINFDTDEEDDDEEEDDDDGDDDDDDEDDGDESVTAKDSPIETKESMEVD